MSLNPLCVVFWICRQYIALPKRGNKLSTSVTKHWFWLVCIEKIVYEKYFFDFRWIKTESLYEIGCEEHTGEIKICGSEVYELWSQQVVIEFMEIFFKKSFLF